MGTNRERLNWLFETHQIDLQRGPLFDHPPSPLPPAFDFGRIEGMMLGLAIGDALGNSTEGKLPPERQALHGEIRDCRPHPRWQGKTRRAAFSPRPS